MVTPEDLDKLKQDSVSNKLALTTPSTPLRNIPGGPKRKVAPRPGIDDLEYHREMTVLKTKFIMADALVEASSSTKDPIAILKLVKAELAREAADLLFTRIEAEKYGRDTSQISSKRIAALKEIAGLELEIKKMGVNLIDVHGEQFQRIFKYFLECIQEIAQETLTPEQADLFFNRLGSKLENWEEVAQGLVR